MMKRAFVAALLAAAPVAAQQQPDTLYIRNNFVKREARIPMRDGVHLFTTIYVPKDTTQRHPILLRRTPYSAGPYGDTNYVQVGGFLLAIAEQGYVIAFHPALRLISPQAPVADWFIGDDFHHNGALYLAHTHFFSGFGQPRPAPTTHGRPWLPVLSEPRPAA